MSAIQDKINSLQLGELGMWPGWKDGELYKKLRELEEKKSKIEEEIASAAKEGDDLLNKSMNGFAREAMTALLKNRGVEIGVENVVTKTKWVWEERRISRDDTESYQVKEPAEGHNDHYVIINGNKYILATEFEDYEQPEWFYKCFKGIENHVPYYKTADIINNAFSQRNAHFDELMSQKPTYADALAEVKAAIGTLINRLEKIGYKGNSDLNDLYKSCDFWLWRIVNKKDWFGKEILLDIYNETKEALKFPSRIARTERKNRQFIASAVKNVFDVLENHKEELVGLKKYVDELEKTRDEINSLKRAIEVLNAQKYIDLKNQLGKVVEQEIEPLKETITKKGNLIKAVLLMEIYKDNYTELQKLPQNTKQAFLDMLPQCEIKDIFIKHFDGLEKEHEVVKEYKKLDIFKDLAQTSEGLEQLYTFAERMMEEAGKNLDINNDRGVIGESIVKLFNMTFSKEENGALIGCTFDKLDKGKADFLIDQLYKPALKVAQSSKTKEIDTGRV